MKRRKFLQMLGITGVAATALIKANEDVRLGRIYSSFPAADPKPEGGLIGYKVRFGSGLGQKSMRQFDASQEKLNKIAGNMGKAFAEHTDREIMKALSTRTL